MEEKQRRRIERYLLNSSRFLWALGPKLKKKPGQSAQNATYDWLQGKDLDFARANYSEVTRQLLRHPGIEELIRSFIVPLVKEEYPEDTLNKLRMYWQKGETPKYDEIVGLATRRRDNSDEDLEFAWRPFLEISYLPKDEDRPSSKYVKRWGEFAGVWFEEIEPWIRELESSDKE